MNTKNCIVCKSNNIAAAYDLRDYRLNNRRYFYHYDKCLDCGLIFQNPQVDFDTIINHYNHQPIYKSNVSRNGIQRILNNFGLKKRANVVLKHKPTGKLLDVGCGNGVFIDYVKNNSNLEVVGTEINVDNVTYLTGKKGLDVRLGNLNEISFTNQEFDIITLWDVIEHLNDPNHTLAEIKKLLKPDGNLIIRVPNGNSVDFALFGKYWAGLDAPRHLYVFSKKSLSYLLSVHGFQIISSNYHIGGYLNTLTSLEFFLNDQNISLKLRKHLLKLFRNQILQIIFSPMFWVSSLFHLGTSMTITASLNNE